ncbi:MAG: bifunctional diaminohydroxyphosphoribosylaminopyrimidine deaminase/5-amino-6-(5-phosphoribosylamino)uracil reductase RibD [Bacteroidales bacterium]|nr:bifunctional diaminohydroxyphosphoribosylaminopyrimidine deaminase/5-amino-6-(5-phosphoribosylamino)uracil reductase RibD [Bacteroidales bacterium]
MSEFAMDSIFMKRCLQLAANGRATCSPNPMVGAVVVHQGRIIGEGWHRKAGEPHAEPQAIHSVKNQALLKEATLYVSLEPCSHYGKTPPCADLIVEKQIPRVVIGSLDPFPLVSGRGVSKLRAAGIEVSVGIEETACIKLNLHFFQFHRLKRPFIILKWSQTADGFLDIIRKQGDCQSSLKISTPFTQMLVHKLRSECDVILVGTKTALLDNPALNTRFWTGKNPVRAVLDRQMILPSDSVLLNGEIPTIVFTEKPSQKRGKISWVHLDFNKDIPGQILQDLYTRNLQTLLVEGGTFLHESFLKAGLWDEIHIETSTQYIGEGVSAPDLSGVPVFQAKFMESDSGINGRKISIFRSSEAKKNV